MFVGDGNESEKNDPKAHDPAPPSGIINAMGELRVKEFHHDPEEVWGTSAQSGLGPAILKQLANGRMQGRLLVDSPPVVTQHIQLVYGDEQRGKKMTRRLLRGVLERARSWPTKLYDRRRLWPLLMATARWS